MTTIRRAAAVTSPDDAQQDSALALARIFGADQAAAATTRNQALCAAVHRVAGAVGFKLAADPRQEAPLTPESVAAASAVRCRRLRLPDQWWRRDLGPLLAFLLPEDAAQADEAAATPVALLPRVWGGYRLHDPVSGRSHRVTAAVAARIAPSVWCYFAVLPDAPQTLTRVLNFGALQSWRDWAMVLLAGGGSALLAVALPYAIALMFSDLVPAGDRGRLLQVGIALALTALAAFGMDAVSALAHTRISGRSSLQMAGALWDRLLRLPAGTVQGTGAGQMAASLVAGEDLRDAVSQISFTLATRGQQMLVSLGTLFVVAPLIAGAALLLGGVMSAAVWLTMLLQDRAIREGKPMSGDVFNQPIEYLSAIGKLRSAAAEERAFARWAADYTEMRRRAVRAGAVNLRFQAFCSLYEVVALGFVFWLVARPGGALSQIGLSGTLVLISALGTYVATLLPLAQSVAMLRVTLVQGQRLNIVLGSTPVPDARAALPGELQGAVEVSNVSVRYNAGAPLALTEVSLSVQPGEFVAIVGPSGGGKSTLVRVLLGLMKPEAGSVTYDGRDLQTLSRDAVRRQIGTVMQGGHLVPGNLLENIAGPHDVTLDDAWEAARIAAVDEDIAAMPMQMYTMVLDGASSFSGGQVQRILVARSLVSRPPIVIFDEATSALDGRAQAELVERMAELKCTRIVIAHRFSTVRQADRIYVMQHGRITEQGSVEELMDAGGYVTEVARREHLGADDDGDDDGADENSADENSGNENSGNENSGDENSGDENTGGTDSSAGAGDNGNGAQPADDSATGESDAGDARDDADHAVAGPPDDRATAT